MTSKKFEPGDLVIVNEVDRPCARLIAEVMHNGGDWPTVQYLDRRVGVTDLTVKPERLTHLVEFGVRPVPFRGLPDMVKIERLTVGVATYSNGEHRPWQPEQPDIIELRDLSTTWVNQHLVTYYMRRFAAASGHSITSYVLPFINQLHAGELTVVEAQTEENKISNWIKFEQADR